VRWPPVTHVDRGITTKTGAGLTRFDLIRSGEFDHPRVGGSHADIMTGIKKGGGREDLVRVEGVYVAADHCALG
jgi:hypothetical protein